MQAWRPGLLRERDLDWIRASAAVVSPPRARVAASFVTAVTRQRAASSTLSREVAVSTYSHRMHFEDVFNGVAVGFEAIGALTMVVGFVMSLVLAVRALRRGEGGQIAYSTLRNTLGAAILLGLEVLVAADLIRTITSKPSIEDAVILGIIVLIRTVLSMSIQIEIEGVVPWKRALLTSGASVAGRELARDAAAQAASRTRTD